MFKSLKPRNGVDSDLNSLWIMLVSVVSRDDLSLMEQVL